MNILCDGVDHIGPWVGKEGYWAFDIEIKRECGILNTNHRMLCSDTLSPMGIPDNWTPLPTHTLSSGPHILLTPCPHKLQPVIFPSSFHIMAIHKSKVVCSNFLTKYDCHYISQLNVVFKALLSCFNTQLPAYTFNIRSSQL